MSERVGVISCLFGGGLEEGTWRVREVNVRFLSATGVAAGAPILTKATRKANEVGGQTSVRPGRGERLSSKSKWRKRSASPSFDALLRRFPA
jgi:hypothetical protein